MLGTPVDAWYVWVGVSVVALAVLGAATAATPDRPDRTDAVETTVETVLAAEPPASARHPIDTDRVRIGPHRVELGVVGRDVAVVRGGPITPAGRGDPLRAVALGAPPEDVFDSASALRAAADEAREGGRTVAPAGDELVVRAVAWEDANVTVVTA